MVLKKMNGSSHITNHRSPITDHPRVSIIILNWNGWEDTIECLESLYQITYSNYDVIVVDNGSEDESIEKIKEYAEGEIKVESKFFEYDPSNKPIEIIEYIRGETAVGGGKENVFADLPSNRKLIIIKNEKNYGFAEGNNIGIRHALKVLNPDYVLFLNNDTVIPEGGALKQMVEFMDEHPEAGAMSPQEVTPEGKKVWTSNRVHTLLTLIFGSTILGSLFKNNRYYIYRNMLDMPDRCKNVLEIDLSSNACMIHRKKTLDEIGLLDERLFLFFTEDDMCRRIKERNWKIYQVPHIEFIHFGSQSTKKENRTKINKIYRKDMLTFCKKHLGYLKACLLELCIILNFIPINVYKLLHLINMKNKEIIDRKTIDVIDNQSEFYNQFHKNAGIRRKIVDRNNFTYHIVLSFIDKHLQPDMKVLDIGCGIGTISLYVANKGNEVLGTDISEKAINAAQKSAELLSIKNASFKAIDFLDEEFQEKFDFVICNQVLEHLVDDRKALGKIYRLLNPNGVLYCAVPSIKSPLHRFRMAVFKRDSFDISVGHLRRYSPADLILMLEESGFSVIKIEESDGQCREFLFLTSLGNKLIPYVALPFVRDIITLLDNLMAKTIRASIINIIAKKRDYENATMF